MGMAFWVRRFIVVFAAAFAVIAAAQLLQGHAAGHACREAFVWAAIATSVFLAARMHQSRKRRHCALCRDTPETRDGRPD